jgi:branched-chain amino acid transport system substrate-binding protein
MRNGLIISLLTILLFSVPYAFAQEDDEPGQEITLPDEIVCQLDIIVQRDDWLSKLADKFYGDLFAYPAIFEATNAKNAEDASYAFIEDEDLIEPGWKLCIVGVDAAEQILGFELDDPPIADDTPTNLSGAITVGVAHAFSGPLAGVGESVRNGIELAVNDINGTAFLGGGVLEIIWEDTAGEKEQASVAFDKLINEDEVVAILGPTLSRSAFVTAPVAQAAGVPVIGSTNTAGGISTFGDYVFFTNLPESVIIEATVERAVEQFNLESAVMLYDNQDAFASAGHNAFRQALQEQDVDILATFGFAPGSVDFSEQLNEIQTLNPDAVIINALAEEAAAVLLQARQAELSEEIRFIGGNSFNAPAFFALGGDAVNGTISGTAWNINNLAGNNRQFVAAYEETYGRLPDQLAAQSYSAIVALATALRNADSTDPAAIRDALDDMERIETPLGLFTFDDNRNPSYSPVVQVVEDGAFVILPQ